MRVFLITGHQYPVGTAMSNRMRSYLEAMARQGVDVNVLIYRASEDHNNVQNARQGELNGVKYQSSAFFHIKSKNPIKNRITRFYSYCNCIKILKKEERNKHIDIIIQASAKSSIIPFVYLYTRKTKTKFVLENNEYPWFILKKRRKFSHNIDKFLYLGIYYRLFDGFMIMTTSLIEFHKKYQKKNAMIHHIPMTVDIKRFQQSDKTKKNYITYIGNKSFSKDGVDYLLKSFVKISPTFPAWKLIIIGDTGNDSEIKSMIESLHMQNEIILKGYVNRDEVPNLLLESKILTLARPNNKQAEGGFPTKLGEYLATSNLVIVTAVGDIPNYLIDKVSALVAEPDSVESFSAKLEYGIRNYETLESVREEGKRICETIFNADVQGTKLIEFFNKLTNERVN